MLASSGRRLGWRTGAVGLLILAACSWGTRPRRYPPANGPQGATVAVRVHGENADRRGELFAVDSIGVTIHAARLTRIAWSRVRALRVQGLSRYAIREGELVTTHTWDRLALVSRFPQGWSPALLQAVLDRLPQDALDEVKE